MVLRFRSPGCRRAKLRTASLRARLPACTPRFGHPRGHFCFIASLRDHPSYSRFRCSALQRHRLLWPLLTSADASENLWILVASRHACRSPRVLRTLLPAYARRIYGTALCTRTGLCKLWLAYPAMTPLSASCSSRQRFAFSFLQTPSRPGSPCRQLALPRVGWAEDFHLQESAPCRAHHIRRGGNSCRPSRITQLCVASLRHNRSSNSELVCRLHVVEPAVDAEGREDRVLIDGRVIAGCDFMRQNVAVELIREPVEEVLRADG